MLTIPWTERVTNKEVLRKTQEKKYSYTQKERDKIYRTRNKERTLGNEDTRKSQREV